MTVAALVAAALALVVTALAQWRGSNFERALRTRDAFCLLPLWTFFAPHPGTTDTRLLWRESLGPWRELSPPRRRALDALWNPERRVQKAITDAGNLLAEARSREDPGVVMLSVPYLLLLSYVTAQPGSPHGVARQFVLVQTSGKPPNFDEVTVLFASHWHATAATEARRAA